MSRKKSNEPRLPPPEPLRGVESGSFAELTLSSRLPGIARRVMENNHWSDKIVEQLQDLIDEMPNGELSLLNDPQAPDNLNWTRYMKPYIGQTWLQAPWFVVEMYFFRRILKATGYFQAGNGIDPYIDQKKAELPAALTAIQPLCDQLSVDISNKDSSSIQKQDLLAQILRTNIWGNQADLSLWPGTAGIQPDRPNADQQTAFLLGDDSIDVSMHLISLDKPDIRVDFVLDNVGLELAYDLILADYLLSSCIAQKINFNLKPYPTYVSDVTKADVFEHLAFFRKGGSSAVNRMVNRLEGYISENRLCLVSDYYWVSPLMGWEMPITLYQELSHSDLIISKGDANYRRWVGDRKWPTDTRLQDGLSYLPAAMVSLRVLKSEVIIGLQPKQAFQMDERDPEWMFNGRWGVIQFVPLISQRAMGS